MYNKKRETHSARIWAAIDTVRYASGIRKQDLAKMIGVHPNTVSNDSADPERIPLGRLLLYCKAVGISPDVIMNALITKANERLS